MWMCRLFLSLICILGLHTPSLFADSEAPNWPKVFASQYGRFYAKSVPDEIYGTAGKTYVYQVGKLEDELLYTYDWYSHDVDIIDIETLVYFGPWLRGCGPKEGDFVIGFCKNGKIIRKYSALDLIDAEYPVECSVSHYTVIDEIIGEDHRDNVGDFRLFKIKLVDGRTISFDVNTGEMLSDESIKHHQMVADVESQIWGIHSDWLHKNDYPEDQEPTIEELNKFAGEKFPDIPEGYEFIYSPSSNPELKKKEE